MLGNENYANVSEAIKDEYNERGSLLNEYENKYECQIYQYHMHDGKMLYLLTKHSLWNRKHYPFLMCKCKRGHFFQNQSACKLITQEKHIKYWEKSKEHFDNEKEKKYHTLLKHTKIGLTKIILDALILECI